MTQAAPCPTTHDLAATVGLLLTAEEHEIEQLNGLLALLRDQTAALECGCLETYVLLGRQKQNIIEAVQERDAARRSLAEAWLACDVPAAARTRRGELLAEWLAVIDAIRAEDHRQTCLLQSLFGDTLHDLRKDVIGSPDSGDDASVQTAGPACVSSRSAGPVRPSVSV